MILNQYDISVTLSKTFAKWSFAEKSGRMVVSRLKLSTGRRVGHIQLCLSEEGAESESPERALIIEDLCKMVFRRKSGAFSAGTLQNTPDARN